MVGKELVEAAPCEFTIGNLVRRVLFMIREEYTQKLRFEHIDINFIIYLWK